MKFAPTEEQEMLRKTARDFLTDKCSKKFVKQMEESDTGYSVELWREMAELAFGGGIQPGPRHMPMYLRQSGVGEGERRVQGHPGSAPPARRGWCP